MHHYPQGLLMLMLLRMMPALGKRKATTFSAREVHAQSTGYNA